MMKIKISEIERVREKWLEEWKRGNIILRTMARDLETSPYVIYNEYRKRWEPWIPECGTPRREVYKIIKRENDCYVLEKVIVAAQGGRADGIIELGPNENSEMLTANGWVDEIAEDLFVIFNHGWVTVIRGKITTRAPASVHGYGKIKRHQEIIIWQEIEAEPKYEYYIYNDGSYAGCTVLILKDGKTIYKYFDRYVLKPLDKIGKAAVIRVDRKPAEVVAFVDAEAV